MVCDLVSEPILTLPVAILAAGEGSRLRTAEVTLPKPCMPLRGMTIAQWSLRAFCAAGVGEFVVGIGFEADTVGKTYQKVAAELGCEVELLPVTGWEKGNGVTALALVRYFSGRSHLLSMADHLFSPRMIKFLCQSSPGADKIALAVDSHSESFVDLDDLTKVRISDGQVTAIGKDISPWDAGDSGLFVGADSLARSLEAAQADSEFSLSDGVRRCASSGLVDAVTLPEPAMWIDLDTPEDLHFAAQKRTDLLAEISPPHLVNRNDT